MLHILLADDHPMVVHPLAQELAKEPDFCIVDVATNPQQIWEKLKQLQVDLLVLDVIFGRNMRDLSLAWQIQQQYPTLKIVLLTGETSNILLIKEANKMGLTGYLSKTIDVNDLIYSLRKAGKGDRVFSPDILKILLSGQIEKLPDLTRHETAILNLLMLGMKRDAICKELEVKAKSTYDTHVQNLKDKFNAASTSELLRKAAELGYV